MLHECAKFPNHVIEESGGNTEHSFYGVLSLAQMPFPVLEHSLLQPLTSLEIRKFSWVEHCANLCSQLASTPEKLLSAMSLLVPDVGCRKECPMVKVSCSPVLWSLRAGVPPAWLECAHQHGYLPWSPLQMNSTPSPFPSGQIQSLPGSLRTPLTQLGSVFLVPCGQRLPCSLEKHNKCLVPLPLPPMSSCSAALNWTCKYPQKVNVFKC